MGEISWTESVTNKHGINEKRNILHAVKRRKANWICRILRGNCLLKDVIVRKEKRKDRSDGKTRKEM
jgi:hypothetical protein